MTGLDPTIATAENYRRFARHEAHGRSPAYEVLADEVAEDEVVLDFLTALPRLKRQPNLLFASAFYLLGRPAQLADLHSLIATRREEFTALIQSRRTQTNEASRCATLLPALASIPGPLSLIEVGAAAGLCLLVDHYSYDYSGHRIEGSDPQAPVFACRTSGPLPRPQHVPDIAWRAGLDLNPLNVTNDDDMRWLSCLVWPGEADRQDRLAAAIAVARRDPPEIRTGDLLSDIAGLAGEAPSGSTLVIFHSAVLAYVDAATRAAFADAVRDLGAVWLSNEGVGVLPDVAAPDDHRASFALVRDGDQLLAFTDPHGTWIEWVDGAH